jgi:hypothetical protein
VNAFYDRVPANMPFADAALITPAAGNVHLSGNVVMILKEFNKCGIAGNLAWRTASHKSICFGIMAAMRLHNFRQPGQRLRTSVLDPAGELVTDDNGRCPGAPHLIADGPFAVIDPDIGAANSSGENLYKNLIRREVARDWPLLQPHACRPVGLIERLVFNKCFHKRVKPQLKMCR